MTMPAAYSQQLTEYVGLQPSVLSDADTRIYLFGTVHMLKPGLSWFDEGVKTAFDASDALVLELVMPEQATAKVTMKVRKWNPNALCV